MERKLCLSPDKTGRSDNGECVDRWTNEKRDSGEWWHDGCRHCFCENGMEEWVWFSRKWNGLSKWSIVWSREGVLFPSTVVRIWTVTKRRLWDRHLNRRTVVLGVGPDSPAFRFSPSTLSVMLLVLDECLWMEKAGSWQLAFPALVASATSSVTVLCVRPFPARIPARRKAWSVALRAGPESGSADTLEPPPIRWTPGRFHLHPTPMEPSIWKAPFGGMDQCTSCVCRSGEKVECFKVVLVISL